MRAVLGRGDLGASLLYVFPLLLVYDIGVMFSPIHNGVDFLSRWIHSALGQKYYVIVHLVALSLFLLLVVWMRRNRHPTQARFVPMFLESGVFALTLGSVILFVMQYVLRMDPSLAAGGLGSGAVLSIGAGVHEELVFRLGLCAGGAFVGRHAGLKHRWAVAVAFLISSLVFSAVHHVGALGDPFRVGVFVYRTLAGLAFAMLFYFRSLAHATYTHALYDVYVMLLR